MKKEKQGMSLSVTARAAFDLAFAKAKRGPKKVLSLDYFFT
jgi:hypothetical protein